MDPWVHGAIPRSEAEALLHNNGSKEGLFLVRVKDHSAGIFAVSLTAHGRTLHFKVERHGPEFYVNAAPFFGCTTVAEVVQNMTRPSPLWKYPLRHYVDNNTLKAEPMKVHTKGQAAELPIPPVHPLPSNHHNQQHETAATTSSSHAGPTPPPAIPPTGSTNKPPADVIETGASPPLASPDAPPDQSSQFRPLPQPEQPPLPQLPPQSAPEQQPQNPQQSQQPELPNAPPPLPARQPTDLPVVQSSPLDPAPQTSSPPVDTNTPDSSTTSVASSSEPKRGVAGVLSTLKKKSKTFLRRKRGSTSGGLVCDAKVDFLATFREDVIRTESFVIDELAEKALATEDAVAARKTHLYLTLDALTIMTEGKEREVLTQQRYVNVYGVGRPSDPKHKNLLVILHFSEDNECAAKGLVLRCKDQDVFAAIEGGMQAAHNYKTVESAEDVMFIAFSTAIEADMDLSSLQAALQ